MIGTRGAPARYGGFETAVEEIGKRLVEKGHQVTVYCRGEDKRREYLGMRRVVLPALKRKQLETLSHTFLSVLHLQRRLPDVALVFNAANVPAIPLLRLRGVPTAIHMDGLEWKRAKWGPVGQRYYLMCERLAPLLGQALIADAQGIQDYYRDRYDVETVFIPYGAEHDLDIDASLLARVGVTAGNYHLVVARFEPENHVDVVLEGYNQSEATKPLVVVGSAPFAQEHTDKINALAGANPNVKMLGAVWDQDLLNALYANAASYLHGHSVGGTNPSLLRAMACGAATSAWDVNFNREVLFDTGIYFDDADTVARCLTEVETKPSAAADRKLHAQERVQKLYQWDEVADDYESLCKSLVRSN